MIKRILLCAGIFIAVFSVTLLAVFPLTSIVRQEVDRQIALYNIKLSYTNLESGIFSTTMDGITYMDVPVGNLKVSYSPLSVLTHKVRLTTDSSIAAINALFKGNTLNADVSADLQRLLKIAGPAVAPGLDVDLKGQAVVNGTYDVSTKKGKLALSGTDFHLQAPGLPVTIALTTFSAEAELDNTTISILSFTSEPLPISITGQIIIDPNETKRSPLNLQGEVGVFKFSVRGTIGRPVASLN